MSVAEAAAVVVSPSALAAVVTSAAAVVTSGAAVVVVQSASAAFAVSVQSMQAVSVGSSAHETARPTGRWARKMVTRREPTISSDFLMLLMLAADGE